MAERKGSLRLQHLEREPEEAMLARTPAERLALALAMHTFVQGLRANLRTNSSPIPTASLQRLFQVMVQHGCTYVVTGDTAMAVWGSPQVTMDVDLLVAASDFRSLVEQSQAWGWSTVWRKWAPGDPVGDVVSIQAPDLMAQLIQARRRHEREAIERAEPITWGGLLIPVVRPEDLILLKAFADGPNDWEDIRWLCEHLADQLDMAYLRRALQPIRWQSARTRLSAWLPTLNAPSKP